MAVSTSMQALIKGEQVSGSKLNGKLRDELLAEGLLLVVFHGSRQSFRARDVEALKRFLTDKDRLLEVDASDSRASMATKTGNSKLVMVRSCPGFPVNSYEPIECRLNGYPFMINPQEGSFLFVTDWKTFIIPEDVIVIGIENMENFRMIRWQKAFFEKYLQSHEFSLCPDIHNQQTLDDGYVLFPIIIFISVILIWREYISFFLNFNSI